jgi:hypothetical protein
MPFNSTPLLFNIIKQKLIFVKYFLIKLIILIKILNILIVTSKKAKTADFNSAISALKNLFDFIILTN